MAEITQTDEPEIVPQTRLEAGLLQAANLLFYAFSLGFFIYLFRYYMTGIGGPTLLAVSAVPLAVCIVYLNDLRKGNLYPRLGPVIPWFFALAYILFSLYSIYYLVSEFDNIRIYRIGIWNNHDLIVGGGMAVLVLEYARRHYFALFVINIILLLYTLFGYMVPGTFNHPGMSFRRVVSSVSVEMSTGIFERLAQLGLTLIGSFILVLAVLRAFGCIDSILQASSRIAARSPKLLPQAAIIGSFGVAAVSGSGAANAATTGSATIPALIRAGFPRTTAAAVETASSLGGQLMPPLMGIAAFLMAEYLRESYFEVVARGFVPAIVYFIGVAFAVYLLGMRYQHRAVAPEVEPIRFMDKVNIGAYFLAVAGLIYLMGVERRAAMSSAQNVFIVLFVGLTVAFLFRVWRQRDFSVRTLSNPFVRLIESFSNITSELTVLLATLGVLTASFTITGVPTKVGTILMEGAGVNIAVMGLVAFAFGYVVGMGLPVAPTYIITAVVIVPFMIQAGMDPWVVHFFAFFVAVFGELSPPTSVVAAVTSRIAEAPLSGP
ncbi:TRAP transporter large permease subunit [Fodinicurvata halophila]|uniref:TRAP transporter large permease subunit n=1 Tax=Fodinicurvata halophila TaxID=1419723 RepID=UPI0036389CBA